jgi:hypothetical protein
MVPLEQHALQTLEVQPFFPLPTGTASGLLVEMQDNFAPLPTPQLGQHAPQTLGIHSFGPLPMPMVYGLLVEMQDNFVPQPTP